MYLLHRMHLWHHENLVWIHATFSILSPMKKHIWPIALISASLCLIPIKHQLAIYKKDEPKPEEYQYLPNTDFVRIMSMGHKTTLAGLYWVDATTYFGERYLNDEEAVWMLHLVALITELDPLFKTGYMFTGTILKSSDDSLDLTILKRGLEHFPEDWRLALFYSLREIEKNGDYHKAAETMEKFSSIPDAPEYVKHIYRTFLAKGSATPIALDIYLTDYQNQADFILKKAIRNKIIALDTTSVNREENQTNIMQVLDSLENKGLTLMHAKENILHILE